MILFTLLFLYGCFCSSHHDLKSLERSFNQIRIRMQLETLEAVSPSIFALNKQVDEILDEDYSGTMKLLSQHD